MHLLTGSLGAEGAEDPAGAVTVSARRGPSWATAAAVEEALQGDERLHRAAYRLRASLHELRVGNVAPRERWLDRWRRAAPGRAVVITHADQMDGPTAELLLRAHAGLGHPVHLRFDVLPTEGPLGRLAARLDLAPVEATSVSPRLPSEPHARLVLRAAAALQGDGEAFDVADVGARLGLPPVRVLEALQLAVEGGFPLADYGSGRLGLPPEARMVLAEGLLPSLVEAWAQPMAEPAPTPVPEVADVAPGTPEARVREARRVVDAAPEDPEAQGRALLELAQSLRSRPGLGVRLEEAIDAARGAVEALGEGDLHLLAVARSTLAHLLVEHGHPSSLDEALDHIVVASRALSEGGEAAAASALLNDQAEVWLKLGDPVRAAHLLHAAEEALAGRQDALAEVERAETAHLLARIPLYAPTRPGRERDALERALEHLDGAEPVYRRLGWADRYAHVLDTRGRLLGRLGRSEEAVDSLSSAAETYRRLGDGLGLARATEGLAGVWADAGHLERAVALLEQSLVLNAAARSPAGLAYVRRATETLPAEGTEALRARLADAERSVGGMDRVSGP